MTETQPSAPIARSVMPTYLDTIASTLLMGAAAPLVSRGLVTADQEQQIIGGILALISVAWTLINASPSRRSPVAVILSLVARSGQGVAYNAAVGQAESWLAAAAAAFARKEARQVGGPVFGPMAAPIAAKVAEEAVQSAARSWLYPAP